MICTCFVGGCIGKYPLDRSLFVLSQDFDSALSRDSGSALSRDSGSVIVPLQQYTYVQRKFIYITCEPPRGKTDNVVSEQVRHKPACTSTEKS